MTSRAVLAAAAVAALAGCDNRQAYREPDPTLARMLDQRRADPYEASRVFADGKTMRAPPEDTVARDAEDDRPPRVTREHLALGRSRFERVCSTCHGMAGDGVSVVASKMTRRPPPSLHEDRLRALSRDQIHAIVTSGYGLMPAYTDMLGADDRWAVAAYVKALQLSRRAAVADLPQGVRAELAAALAKETP